MGAKGNPKIGLNARHYPTRDTIGKNAVPGAVTSETVIYDGGANAGGGVGKQMLDWILGTSTISGTAKAKTLPGNTNQFCVTVDWNFWDNIDGKTFKQMYEGGHLNPQLGLLVLDVNLFEIIFVSWIGDQLLGANYPITSKTRRVYVLKCQ